MLNCKYNIHVYKAQLLFTHYNIWYQVSLGKRDIYSFKLRVTPCPKGR